MRLVYGVIDNRRTVESTVLWCTYRKCIPGIGSDKGWGCMLRCSQMLQCHVIHRLNNPTTWNRSFPDALTVRKFKDDGNSEFSLQCFLAAAMGRGISVREWIGPQMASLIIQDMLSRFLQVAMCEDRVLYLDEFKKDQPCLILVPLRLGGAAGIFPHYEQDLVKYMQWPQFAGVLGGTPKHALYLIGYSIESAKLSFLGVDPHVVHDVDEDLIQRNIRNTSYRELDPCMTIAFFSRGTDDANDLIERLKGNGLTDVAQSCPDYSLSSTVICEDEEDEGFSQSEVKEIA